MSSTSGGSASCKLYWTRSLNLNNRSFLSGTSFAEVRVGPYLEGQKLDISVRAMYEPPIPISLIPCPKRTIRYESSLGEKERISGLNFDKERGIVFGAINDIDQYLSLQQSTIPFQADGKELSYIPVAKRPNPRRITIYIKAYFEDEPDEFIEGNFYMDIAINWNTKRRSLIVGPRAIQTDFFVEGKPASNQQYYSYLQSKKYIR